MQESCVFGQVDPCFPFPKQSLSEESFDDRKTFQYALFSLTSRNSKVTYFIAYRSWWSRKTSNDCFTVVKWHFPYELLWNFRGSCYDNTWWLFGGQPRQCIWIKKRVSCTTAVWSCYATNLSSYRLKNSVAWHGQTTGAKDARKLSHLS